MDFSFMTDVCGNGTLIKYAGNDVDGERKIKLEFNICFHTIFPELCQF